MNFYDYGDYLYKEGIVKDKEWTKNYLIPQIKRSFISSAKLIQD